MTITPEEIELLASLLQRAGVTQIVAMWANVILNKLRQLAIAQREEEVGAQAPGATPA